MLSVAVTGANGFVGRVLVGWLLTRGIEVRALVRKIDARCDELATAEVVEIGDMTAVSDWQALLEGMDAVVHLAARVHAMNAIDEQIYAKENIDVTERLAIGAKAARLSHFVFVSSIKVNGERTFERPFTAFDPPQPQDPYGRSKLEAEIRLRNLTDESMRLTIIRPPLVYGPGVGANFGRLLALVRSGVPVPLGRVVNKRSIVSVWNLADLIFTTLTSAPASVQTLLVADGEVPSTIELMQAIARAMGVRVRVLPVPLSLLRFFARAIGRHSELSRLTDSLVVDATATRTSLNWSPPLSLQEGLARTVEVYIKGGRE